jgi:hypothetical protein
MPSKSSVIVCLLSLFPLFGFAQSDAYVLQRVLQRYTEAYGGFGDANSLSSLSVEGTIEQDGQTFDFFMRKKRPDSFRYRLSNASNSVVTGYNGSSAWLRTTTNGEVSITELDGQAASVIREQARFDSPLFRYLERSEDELELLERTTFEGHSVYLIEVRVLGRGLFHYYLESEAAHVLRRDQLDADTGAILVQTLYRDYREVDGYPFAYEVETLIDGQRVSLAKINSIDVNPGILSFYFEQPSR